MKLSEPALPLVSVVIPAYNASNYIEYALQSVTNQDYPNLEILVIDDASPERIENIINDYKRSLNARPLKMIRHAKNQGQGAARNTGIEAAAGEYIAFLDHDDLWATNHIFDIIQSMLINECDVGFCSAIEFSESIENSTGVWGPDKKLEEINIQLEIFKRSFISPSSAIIKKTVLQRLRGFNPSRKVHACEDFDLWLRLASQGFKFHYSQVPSAYYRKHNRQITENHAYLYCQTAYVRQLHAKKIKGHFFEIKSLVARSWWQAFNHMCINDTFRWSLLMRALIASITVPNEALRGLYHMLNLKKST